MKRRQFTLSTAILLAMGPTGAIADNFIPSPKPSDRKQKPKRPAGPANKPSNTLRLTREEIEALVAATLAQKFAKEGRKADSTMRQVRRDAKRSEDFLDEVLSFLDGISEIMNSTEKVTRLIEVRRAYFREAEAAWKEWAEAARKRAEAARKKVQKQASELSKQPRYVSDGPNTFSGIARIMKAVQAEARRKGINFTLGDTKKLAKLNKSDVKRAKTEAGRRDAKIRKMFGELEKNWAEFKNLKNEIDELEFLIAGIQARVRKLKFKLQKSEKDLADWSSIMPSAERKNLEKLIADLTGQLEYYSAVLAKYKGKYTRLENRVHNMEKARRAIVSQIAQIVLEEEQQNPQEKLKARKAELQKLGFVLNNKITQMKKALNAAEARYQKAARDFQRVYRNYLRNRHDKKWLEEFEMLGGYEREQERMFKEFNERNRIRRELQKLELKRNRLKAKIDTIESEIRFYSR